MKRVVGKNLKEIKPFFDAAAKIAQKATCKRAKCGSVIVKNGTIIAKGYNSPPQDEEPNRMCNKDWDLSIKPKYDKTCCVHAEWRAIIDALKTHPQDIAGSTLYFMRIDEKGNFTDAGEPFCTVCSRLSMEAGIAEFALWNNNGADIYKTPEYNQKSYNFYR